MVSEQVKTKVDGWIKDNHVLVISATYCPYCSATKRLIQGLKVDDAKIVEVDLLPDVQEIKKYLADLTGQSTVPHIFIDGKHYGGNSDIQALNSSGELRKLLNL